LPDDWVCPICGAAKAEFKKQGETAAPVEKKPISARHQTGNLKRSKGGNTNV